MSDLLFTEKQMDQLKTLVNIIKNDPGATATPNASVLHGTSPTNPTHAGLFSSPGVTPRMFSTLVRANGTFTKALPMYSTVNFNDIREIRTGINSSTGTNPTGFCADPIAPGDMKVCMQKYFFGDALMKTQTVLLPTTGEYYNLADVDRQIVPPDTDIGARPFAFEGLMNATNPNTQTYKQMVQLLVNWERQIEQVVFQGIAGTATTDRPFFISEFDGLDRQIRTGYTDAKTGIACAAVDSFVRTFGANLDATSSIGDIVEALTDLYTAIQLSIMEMGYDMDSSMWAFVMHPLMWRPLTRFWPCAYETTGCQVVNNDGQRVNVDAAEQRRFQDQMYTGKYLMIDGMSIPVLFSWGVPNAHVAANGYTSSIYIVPLQLNGERTLFYEHFNMANLQLQEFGNLGGIAPHSVPINNGLYLMGRQDTPFCVDYLFATRLRLLLIAPFAAGRLDGITYTDNVRQRSPFPGDTTLYRDGGVTVRNRYN